MHKTLLAGTLSALLLAGCAGTHFRWEDTERVQTGMTEAEVVSILGKPHARSQRGNISVLSWSYASAFGPARAVSYQFVDGRAAGITTVGK
ncbi:hypothetical protein AN401_07150 [Zobellella denitrificans]|uniref:Outer membrane protein assembly factor BamE domain-containing protein n=1 Tax=Zobellella denitrificans TaxID=347534 RepID=A0A291HNA5_9GAMM|nr:outer membrane protein assembly factor BamE [Zobellella denitrificans]ATG73660.1 hypothetical protein AN401_07150 [Zobellella denitrificans]